jgi:hypothetical protein
VPDWSFRSNQTPAIGDDRLHVEFDASFLVFFIIKSFSRARTRNQRFSKWLQSKLNWEARPPRHVQLGLARQPFIVEEILASSSKKFNFEQDTFQFNGRPI